MNASEAVKRAKEHLSDFMSAVDAVRVEGVESIEEIKHWMVTLSFFDDDASLPSALLAQRNRVFKQIEINESGELIGIKSVAK